MVCARNFCDYNNYYSDQAGGNLDISYYRGAPYQRGGGYLSSFSKRFGVPAIKYLFKQGVIAGKDIMSDVASGQNLKQSIKRNFKKRLGSSFKNLGEKLRQSGRGLRKRPRINKTRRKRRVKRKPKSKGKRKGRKRSKKSKSKKLKFNRFDIFK